MKITILGSGTSSGVPLIGCECAVCRSDNPKNKRRRASILIEKAGKKILIDTSPDLRIQALDNHISTVDAILFTHNHADHTHGIDEVRAFNYNRDSAIDAYGDQATIGALQEKFDYIFTPNIPGKGWYKPCLTPHVIEPNVPFNVAGIEVTAFRQQHGKTESLGFRIGSMAYSTDVNAIPEASEPYVQGLDLWIVTALQYSPHPTHATVDMALEWIQCYQPGYAILTHMAHEIDYNSLAYDTDKHITPAYDGMVITLEN